MIPGSANPLLLGQAGDDAGYAIERSLRFNDADDSKLTKTFSYAGNRRKWTLSFWAKRSALGTEDNMFTGSGNFIRFEPSDVMRINHGSVTDSTRLFRDPSAWYHIVWVWDTAQSDQENRSKVYVNNEYVTFATYPSQNADSTINNNVEHIIGAQNNQYHGHDGYLADFHFIDGQVLAPTDFAELDDDNVWLPKKYSGSYGTNGFHLDFKDNSSNAALGTDTSGNNNTWTVTNLSVAAGVGNDSLLDTPTNGNQTDTGAGGEVVGNYATLNPLRTTSTLSNGNLDASLNTAMGTFTTFFPSSGKWYCEVKLTTGGGSGWRMGVINDRNPGFDLGATSNSWSFLGDGRVYHNAAATSYGSSVSQGANLMLALDIDNGKVWYGSEGNWFSSGNPATGANPSQTFTAGQSMSFAFQAGTGTNQVISANFGARAYNYTAPSGFKSLNTTNLTATIPDGSKYFDTKLWTGNGASNPQTGLGFAPDLVWIKNRDTAGYSNALMDAIRGPSKQLRSNTNGLESTSSTTLTSFDTNGFTVDNNNISNQTDKTYVGWAWEAGSSTVSNTDGSTTAQVRASAASGFSIVSWTGNNNTTTIGHGLGKLPDMIILKNRTGNNDWIVYHAYTGNRQDGWGLNLNNASAAQSNSDFFTQGGNFTSSKIPLGALGNRTTTNIAYVFTSVEGFSKFGSYTGNGSADGPFVPTGFRVAWLMIKNVTTGGELWAIHDSKRDVDNVAEHRLRADEGEQEQVGPSQRYKDLLSNGFKIRGTSGEHNTNNDKYIYAAFASHPFASNGGLAR